MAGYKRKSLQILGGGFSCLPPVDKVPITDYLLAQNLRVDALGRLVSRAGYNGKFSISGAGLAHSAGSFGGVASPLYVGCNSGISNPASAVYYNQNATPIATGFDGNRIGFASQNGYMWVVNRGNQGRHSVAAGWETWNLAAPPASPTVASGSSPSPTASATYTYTVQGNPAYTHYLTIAGVTYSLVENGYGVIGGYNQICGVIAGIAGLDPNCSVTYAGTGNTIVITPIPPNILIPVSGSDGNTPENLANGAITSLPNGTYQYYLTFQSADLSLESNPSAASAAVAVVSQAVVVTIPAADAPVDARIGFVNIYRSGGTQGAVYRVAQIASTSGSPATTFTDTIPDLQVTAGGVTMPTNNDPAPLAAGIIGPYFSQLYAWSTAANVNRLFWTNPDLPQYWPGSFDNQVGNWVDVGDEGEAIVWCTTHTNLLVIYKERSIWMMIGSSPSTATLEKVYDGCGLTGQFALAPAGMIDYFVGANGLNVFDMNAVHEVSGAILPLFNQSIVNAGMLSAPGSILAGSAFNSTSLAPYAVALGHANGKLYVSYAEQGGTYNTLVYNEGNQPESNAYTGAVPGRWFYHRNGVSGIENGFFGFFFDGVAMLGLTGTLSGGAALGYNVDDFRGFLTTDPGTTAIECAWQSHYEDCGLPDNPKVWLEVVVDIELTPVSGSNDTVGVTFGQSNGATTTFLGTITTAGRSQVSFPLAQVSAKNASILVAGASSYGVILHNVYLYYYEDVRFALVATTLPTDLGVGKIKQCKELELDIAAPNGTVAVVILSDLPGNALASRQTPTVASAGRAIRKYPFSITQGLLWQVLLTGNSSKTFQLYSARLLMRVMGAYFEGYELTAGFVLDLQETTLGTDLIKRVREISLEIDTFGGSVTVALLTDLPGNAQTSRFSQAVSNSGGRGFIRLPLTVAENSEIQGRYCRLQFTGAANFALYGASIEALPIGVYIEAYEAAAGAVWDSRQLDFGSAKVKEARELELDIQAGGSVTATLYSDITAGSGTPNPQASVFTATVSVTTGRQSVRIPLTVTAATGQFVDGRQFRLILTGSSAVLLFGARLKIREYGQFVTEDEATLGALWDTTPIDLGTQSVKQMREIELDIWAYGAYTVTVYTDLPGNALASRVSSSQSSTSGRTTVQIPLPQGAVPDDYIVGRLVRITVTSANAVKVFGARIHWRAIGVYIEAYEAAAGAVWDSSQLDFGSAKVKEARELELDIETGGSITATLYSDVTAGSGTPNPQASVFTATVTVTTGRQSVRIPLTVTAATEQFVDGRQYKLLLSGSSAILLYGARLKIREYGQFVTEDEATLGALWDTTPIDLGTQSVKQMREIELDIWAYGAYTVTVYTDLPGNALASRVSSSQSSTSGRTTVQIPLPQGAVPDDYIVGRLVRITVTSANAVKVFGARIHWRAIGVYIEAYEAAAGAVWDSSQLDFGSAKVKEARELELDIQAGGSITATLYSDITAGSGTPNPQASVFTATVTVTTGRQSVRIPLTVTAATGQFVDGRQYKLLLSGSSAILLFGARLKLREYGQFVTEDEATLGALWDTTPIDLGTQSVKQMREIELDIWAYGAYTVTVYTDLPGNALASRVSSSQSSTSGRTTVQIPLPQGAVPDDYIVGRLVRITVTSANAVKVFGARIHWHPIGVYLEGYEAAAGGIWDSGQIDLGSQNVKAIKRIEVDLVTYATEATVTVITSQAGAVMGSRYSYTLATGGDRSPLVRAIPPGIRGRLLQIQISGTACAVYAIRVWWRPLNDPKAEWQWTALSVPATPMTFNWSDLPVDPTPPEWKWAPLAVEPTPPTFSWSDLPVDPTPPEWKWAPLAVEPTPPTFNWSDLPVDPTPPEWKWAPLPVMPTDPQWKWQKIVSVEETPDVWQWVDVPFSVTDA